MNAVIFSGSIGSGKTTVATEVARLLAAPRASFGDFLRRIAVERLLEPNDRAVLQDLGLEFIQEPRSFCCSVLSQVRNWPLEENIVIEGVRHLSALEALRELLSTAKLLVVYMEPPPEIIELRRVERGDDASALSHPVEQEVRAVRDVADLIIRYEDDPEKSAAAIVCRLP